MDLWTWHSISINGFIFFYYTITMRIGRNNFFGDKSIFFFIHFSPLRFYPRNFFHAHSHQFRMFLQLAFFAARVIHSLKHSRGGMPTKLIFLSFLAILQKHEFLARFAASLPVSVCVFRNPFAVPSKFPETLQSTYPNEVPYQR
jgi:hypothetical protein